MLINREKYLSKIRPFYDLDIIKVLMGSRRSGKSKILELIINELLDNAEKKMLNVVKTRKGTEFRKIQVVLTKAQSDIEKLSKKMYNCFVRGDFYGFKKIHIRYS